MFSKLIKTDRGMEFINNVNIDVYHSILSEGYIPDRQYNTIVGLCYSLTRWTWKKTLNILRGSYIPILFCRFRFLTGYI